MPQVAVLREAFYPLPYKEPSATLLQLMGIVVQAGQRFAAISELQTGEGNKTLQLEQRLLFLKEDLKLCLQYTKDYTTQ